MSGGFTARAAANIAFLKYWGAADLERTIPANASLSMTLTECATTSWVGPARGDADDAARYARSARGSLARVARAARWLGRPLPDLELRQDA